MSRYEHRPWEGAQATEAPRRPRRLWPWIAGFFAVVLVWSAASGNDTGENGSPAFAEVACENLVKSRLKAPSTADFSGTEAARGSAAGEWIVTGIVDAENSFGGTVRNSFTCELTHVAGEDYEGTVRLF